MKYMIKIKISYSAFTSSGKTAEKIFSLNMSIDETLPVVQTTQNFPDALNMLNRTIRSSILTEDNNWSNVSFLKNLYSSTQTLVWTWEYTISINRDVSKSSECISSYYENTTIANKCITVWFGICGHNVFNRPHSL